jgi:hypothetical protein
VSRALVVAALALVISMWGGVRPAAAYPQLQLSHDQTCTGCHLSPAGGNLLNENGLAVAESMSQFGTAPEFLNGKLGTPKWLTLGGDLRGQAGYIQSPTKVLTAFPMQIEGYASAIFGKFTVHANVGMRPAEVGNRLATFVFSREHYVMWQQKPGEGNGLYVRLGRFMPVYGLRLAEHTTYIRRYGETQMYADTYGVHAALVEPTYEAHLTGFIKDPVIDPLDHSNGVMAYAEVRPTPRLAVGAEGMYKRSKNDQKFGGGVTGKVYIPGANLVIQGEVQIVNQLIDTSATNAAGGAPLRLIGYLLGSLTIKEYLLLDLGLGHYDSNWRIKNLDRDCIDVNLHWFATSHIEVLLTNRYEMLAFGKGGPSGAYSLAQLHYRL